MANESLATGNNLAGALEDLYNDYLSDTPAVTHISNLLDFPEDELFDILKGWPLGGALTDFNEMEAQLDPNDADITRIARGQWVQYGATGRYELATSPVVASAPKRIMLALANSDDFDVLASSNTINPAPLSSPGTTYYKLPVLTTNYVARIPASLIITGQTLANFTVGAPFVVTDGYLDATTTGKHIVGTVRGKDTGRGTIDVEVA